MSSILIKVGALYCGRDNEIPLIFRFYLNVCIIHAKSGIMTQNFQVPTWKTVMKLFLYKAELVISVDLLNCLKYAENLRYHRRRLRFNMLQCRFVSSI